MGWLNPEKPTRPSRADAFFLFRGSLKPAVISKNVKEIGRDLLRRSLKWGGLIQKSLLDPSGSMPFFVSWLTETCGFESPRNKKSLPVSSGRLFWLAEREGFEPPVPLGTSVFKTGAFNRSATSPLRGAKLTNMFELEQALRE